MGVLRLRTALVVVCEIVAFGASAPVDAGGGIRRNESRLVEMGVSAAIAVSREGWLEERFRIPLTLRTVLKNLEPGASVRVTSFPVAPGEHRTIRIERRSIYSEDARVFEIGDLGLRVLPRSPHLHFLGEIEDEDGSGVVLILDPRTDRLSGTVISRGFSFDLVAADPTDAASVKVVRTSERVAPQGPTWDCGGETLELPDTNWNSQFESKASAGVKSQTGRQVVIAVDTDSELLSQKFSNNTSEAADYIADLFAAINVMYERDLDMTLLLGTTFLRTGSDPYSQNSGGPASSTELSEFRNYWKANYQSENRALAMMLSGKSPSSNSASGIAWVGSLCSPTYGYSFSKVFKIDYMSGDAKVVGHELGHNFGSPHTHCYNPPIDHCWSIEGGCYTGSTSCPRGPGTVMSYCHLVGCGSTLNFHPTVINRILENYVAPATGVCIFAENDTPHDIFIDDFENGSLGRWSETSS